MFRRFAKKRVVVALAAVAALSLAAGAFAYFTSTGSGTGNASVGSSSNYSVTVDAATGGALLPGSGTDTINYHVKNTSSGQQQVLTRLQPQADLHGNLGQTVEPDGIDRVYGLVLAGHGGAPAVMANKR